MRFKIEHFFEIYKYKDDQQKAFSGFEIEHVAYLKLSQKVIVVIKNDNILPYSAYSDLKEYFTETLGTNVALHVEATNQTMAILDMNGYLKEYTNLHNDAFRSALPMLKDGGFVFKYDEQRHYQIDEEYFDDVKHYFAQIGFNQPIDFEYMSNEEAELPDLTIAPSAVPMPKPAPAPVQNNYGNKSGGEGFQKNYGRRRSFKADNYTKVRIDDLEGEVDNVCIKGEIFKIDEIVTRQDKIIQTVYIKDTTNACIAKLFESAAFDKEKLKENKPGKVGLFYGKYEYDKFSNDHVLKIDMIEFIEEDHRMKDECEKKRLELHAHTNYSEMDGVCTADELVEAAFDMGHDAVAITDHYVVQAFPEAQAKCEALLKKNPDRNFKVLYGCEFNMVDERLKIVYNPQDVNLSEQEYVVFDLETTGLSVKFDSVIEFGAVLMYRGNVVERKDFFIKPPFPIPANITKLTNISNDDVKDARTFAECKDEILEFVKGRVLVAHNASFDYGFLNDELRRLNEPPLTNIVIDTLDLAKSMYRERRHYKLGQIAKRFNVSDDEEVAHRADYDAEVLSQIFNLMLRELREKEILTATQLYDYQDPSVFVKKIPYHTNVLVRDKEGLRDLFKLVSISHTDTLAVFAKGNSGDVAAEPRVLRSDLAKHRSHLLVGSGCLNGEIFELAQTRSQAELEAAMDFYDYIEVQPLENYRHLVEYRQTMDADRLKAIIRNIIDTAVKKNKLIVATGDVHFVREEEKILRDVYINALAIGGAHHPLFIYNKEKRAIAKMPDQRFLNTQEMLDAFAWLDDQQLIEDMVINNPHKINEMCEVVKPVHTKLYTPKIEGCEETLTKICYERAHEIYGDPLDEKIEARLKRELDSIIGNGYAVIYYVSHLLVRKSNSDGYLVGSRGSVGSSFVATMSGITEVNPLPPHYVCPHCKHLEWVDNTEYASGFNLPDKKCPECGTIMIGDGHDIPFETFLGFNGDKVPDIDLNFSGENQEAAHLFTREVFGIDHVFRAGTTSTVAEKTAFGYVSGYCEEMGITGMSRAQRQRLASGCEGVKRTTGQHPGGIIVIPPDMDVYDFTPVQYPANDPNSVWRTTHFDFHKIHDNVLKFDILGHVDPTAMRLLQNISGIDPKTIPLNDPKVMSLFNSTSALGLINPDYTEVTGALGLPEFGTKFVRGILELTRPSTFSELVLISGLSHGTDVWNNNAKDLVEKGLALKDVIGCRDDIMITLLKYDLPPFDAFSIMEKVRKGKGLTPEHESLMVEHGVPAWYIESCKKIKYMFPKAHATAYVIMAVRLAWFKVYHPEFFYVSFLTLRCDAYDIEYMTKDATTIKEHMEYLHSKIMSKDPEFKASKKEKDIYDMLEVVYEMVSRDYHITKIDIERSLATRFRVNPDNNHEIIPPFSIMDGLGDNVAESIVKAREERPFLSKEDIMRRTQVSKTLIKELERLGALGDLDESEQMSLF